MYQLVHYRDTGNTNRQSNVTRHKGCGNEYPIGTVVKGITEYDRDDEFLVKDRLDGREFFLIGTVGGT